MSFRSTALFFGLFLGMLWVFGVMLAYKRTAYDPGHIMPSLQASQDAAMDEVVVERKGKDAGPGAVFKNVKDQWFLQTPKGAVRVENRRVESMISAVKGSRKSDETGISNDFSLYGLDNPRQVFVIKGRVGASKDKDKEWKFSIGKDSGDKALVYVNSSDWPGKVFAVPKSAIDSLFFADPNHLRPQRLFEFNDLAVKKLLLKEAKKEVDIQKSDDESWRFVQPPLGFADFEGPPAPKELPPGVLKAETGGVKGLIAAVRGLRVEAEEDFVPAADSNPADYGLAEGKESLRIQVITGGEDKKDETLLVGKKAGKDNQHYARLTSDPGMFRLGGKQLEPILKALEDPGQFRSRDVVPVDAKKTDKIKLTLGKELVQLTRGEDKAWQVQAGSQKSTKAGDKAVEAFLDVVQGKGKIEKFIDDGAAEAKALDGETPAAEIALFTSQEKKKDEAKKEDKKEDKKDEKKADESKPALSLAFGKGDKDTVPVKRVLQDGTVSRFTIARALADKIVPASGALAFLDTALPTFKEDEVATLTLVRGKNKVELQRGGDKTERWLFKEAASSQEKTFADTVKMQSLFRDLANLQAKKWLEKVDVKTDLDKHGLKDPAAVVTVGLWKGPVTATGAAGLLGFLASPFDALLSGAGARTFDAVTIRFGKDTDQEKDKPGTFAQHSGSEMLFLVEPKLVRLLKDLDLRDRSLLTLLQPLLGAGAVAGGPGQLLASSALLSGSAQKLDAAAVKEVKIEVRTAAELRKFQFVRDGKDKGWQDQSNLLEFQLDPEKVKELVKDFSALKAERLVALGSGPRAEFKFGAKEATAKIDLVLDGRTVTVTVGDSFGPGYFAQTTDWPGTVFLLARDVVDPLLRGTAHFGKERVAAAP